MSSANDEASSASCMLRCVEPERWLRAHLSSGRQPDGRPLDEHAACSLQVGVVSAAHGSAICAHGGCTAICAVRGELSCIDPTIDIGERRCGSVLVRVEHSEHKESNSRHDDNKVLTELAQCQNVLQDLMDGDEVLDRASLLLGLADRLTWILYIDVLLLESGQPILDTATIALNAALANTRLPNIGLPPEDTIEVGDDEPLRLRKLQLDIDQARSEPLSGLTDNVPIAVTCGVYSEGKGDCAVTGDPALVIDAGEEFTNMFGSGVTVVAGKGRMIFGVHRFSDGFGAAPEPISPHVLQQCMQKSFERRDQILSLIDQACGLVK